MASENKKSKLKNSGAIAQMLKNSSLKLKRGFIFYSFSKKEK